MKIEKLNLCLDNFYKSIDYPVCLLVRVLLVVHYHCQQLIQYPSMAFHETSSPFYSISCLLLPSTSLRLYLSILSLSISIHPSIHPPSLHLLPSIPPYNTIFFFSSFSSVPSNLHPSSFHLLPAPPPSPLLPHSLTSIPPP
jgi:hypothetical protein